MGGDEMTVPDLLKRQKDTAAKIAALEAEMERRRTTKIKDIQKELSALKRGQKTDDKELFEAWKVAQAADAREVPDEA